MKLSLELLKLDYVDLYLIHFPAGLISKDDEDFFPVDENGKANLDANTDLVALWKVSKIIISNNKHNLGNFVFICNKGHGESS